MGGNISKRAAFLLGDRTELTATELDLIEQPLDGRELALSGPSIRLDPLHRPVRGDLAHVALAGKVFVPHYAVPMPHRIASYAIPLRKSGSLDGEAIVKLAAGEIFNVLDFSGGWAWGQQGDDGFVGYVPQSALAAL